MYVTRGPFAKVIERKGETQKKEEKQDKDQACFCTRATTSLVTNNE